MGLREQINEKPAVAFAMAGALSVLAFMVVWLTFLRTPAGPQGPTTAYFSDDDGATWFVDKISNIPPFDHNGKEAVKVWLYRCGTGQPFVQRLEKYTPEQKKRVEALLKNPSRESTAPGVRGLIKKPGEKIWRELNNRDSASIDLYTKLTTPVCPGGSGDTPTLVLPEEEARP